MNKTLLLKPVLVIAGISLLGAGCVVREEVRYRTPSGVVVESPPAAGEVYVNSEPPAPVVESVTVAPEPGVVWIGGAWFWEGGGWVWRSGHWGHPPRVGAVWVGPRYVFRGGHHVWVRGYWR